MRVTTVAVMLACVFASVVRAEDGEVGIGVIIGDPTGISGKKWIDDENAVAGALAWSLSDGNSIQLHADYLFHRYGWFQPKELKGRVPLYFGVGGRVKLKDDDNGKGKNDGDILIGVRFPLGLSYIFSEAPFDIFVEIAPIFDVVPDADFELTAAIGARFYFK